MKISTCLESAICMKTEYDKILTGSFSPPRPRNSLTPAAQVRRLSMSASKVINVSPLQVIIKFTIFE